MPDTAAILTQRLFATTSAKTAHGLVRGPSRYQIVAVLDEVSAGRDAGEVLDGRHRDIPVLADLDTLLRTGPRPQWLVVGIATPGGVLPDDLRPALQQALTAGISVANGLHEFLGDDANLAAAAAKSGAVIHDIRRPRRRSELHFYTGAIHAVSAPRLAVLGTDCALGKRTTCQLLLAACRQHGLRAEMIYTGQTGWLQGTRHGFVLDSTANDFVAGELEHAIVSCDRELSPDLILLEGQSALRNPSGPCGAELLLSGGASGVILQHAPARRFFEEQEDLGHEIPPLTSEIELIRMYGSRVLAIALNHEHLDAAARDAARAQIEHDTGLPAFYPLLEGCDRVVDVVRNHVADRRHR